jgi:hypothetical protein
MTLYLWEGQLLIRGAFGGGLAIAEECCCDGGGGGELCDCNCDIMESQVLVAEIVGTGVSCTFGFDEASTQESTYCRWRYSAIDPDPCFDIVTQMQINYILLYCWHPLSAREPGKWEMFAEGDGPTGSLGGTVVLTSDPCPPPGTYSITMYDPSFNPVATFDVTIPSP